MVDNQLDKFFEKFATDDVKTAKQDGSVWVLRSKVGEINIKHYTAKKQFFVVFELNSERPLFIGNENRTKKYLKENVYYLLCRSSY